MKRIELSSPIKGPRGTIAHIDLREPRFGDYIALGTPFVWQVAESGGIEVEVQSITGQWIERLADVDPNLLEMLGLRDTFALRDAITDFFREARRPAPSKSTESLDTSSSGSAGTFEPSKI